MSIFDHFSSVQCLLFVHVALKKVMSVKLMCTFKTETLIVSFSSPLLKQNVELD